LLKCFGKKEIHIRQTSTTKDQLHSAIQKAIQELAQENGTFKAGGKWASKFLADRIVTTLKPFLTFTTTDGEEVKKQPTTQKEIKQALNKALEKAAKVPVEKAKEEAAKWNPKSGDSSEDSSEGKFTPTRIDAVLGIVAADDNPLSKTELIRAVAERVPAFTITPDRALERATNLVNSMIKNKQLAIDQAGFVTMKEDNGEAGDLDIEDDTPEDYEAAKDREFSRLSRDILGGRTQSRDSGYGESFERVLQRYESVL